MPGHPVEGGRLRFSIGMDGSPVKEVSYETRGRSEEWKQNVLRNQAIREVFFSVSENAWHQLVITALDEGVTVDQIRIYEK